MNKSVKSKIKQNWQINKFVKNCNYNDCYYIRMNKVVNLNITDCLKPIFEKPIWMKLLYKLRDVLVRPFGLETAKDEQINFDANIGEKLGFFDVQFRNKNEILAYGNDKHLEAWLSIFVENQENTTIVHLATVVRYHNMLGRTYFFCIKPFHCLIIKAVLKRLSSSVC